ncbi:MAG: hypothetical protein JRH15_04470 [Deltaproteobacteria bacterium]|nr:hypothetical protein [Deltaproteobacteria bacterium]
MNQQPAISTALEKRIKRRVVSRPQTFFAATAPGLEPLCFAEIMALNHSPAQASVVPGGVEFTGRLHDCYRFNLHLRTANRILMRINAFRAVNFPQLEKCLSTIAWELYIRPGALPEIHVTASKSRLHHTGAIAQRVLESIPLRLGDTGVASSTPVPKLFIRVVSDRFVVSIDSTGAHLYKRGVKTQGHAAPIRETLAAAALILAGHQPGALLFDPMCGSGTFSIEAAMMAAGVPPGWYRSFAFMDWPAFRLGRWLHIRREAGADFTIPSVPTIFSSDIRYDACRELKRVLLARDLAAPVAVSCRDFFDFTAPTARPSKRNEQQTDSTPGLVVINPPYGMRLGAARESRDLFTEICSKLRHDFARWRFAIIGPAKWAHGRLPLTFKQHRLMHGGLSLRLFTGRV